MRTTALVCGMMAWAGVALAGPITPPPGPVSSTPGPEPRTAINAVNTPGDADSVYRIATPGSYYLTGNVTGVSGKHGIEIAANSVTIDLNGFALVGVTGSLDGVMLSTSSLNNLVVRNGIVASWGSDGIILGSGYGSLVTDLVVTDCGDAGIYTNLNSVVKDCVVSRCGYVGIFTNANTSIENCSVRQSAGIGIQTGFSSSIRGCSARQCGEEGFLAADHSVIQGSEAYANTGDGIVAGLGAMVIDCTANQNDMNGIVVSAGGCVIRGNQSRTNGLAGIRVFNSDSRIEGNNSVLNETGIQVFGAGNVVIGNTVSGNTSLNWSIAANNKCYVVEAANAGAISGDAGGVSPGSTNPWANFTY